MFSKASANSQSQADRSESQNTSIPSIVTNDLVVDGNLSSKGEIQINGKVHGDITCTMLVIGPKGEAVGEVTAETVRLHGKLSGKVRAKSVFLNSTAHMIGDIEHESLGIDPGAFIEGCCKRVVEQQAAAPSSHLVAVKRRANGSGEKAATVSPIGGTG